mgnify:CR=1 FL=1
MIVYFATWLADYNNGELLTKLKQPNRLLSYHWIINHGANKADVKNYIMDGIVYLTKDRKKTPSKK